MKALIARIGYDYFVVPAEDVGTLFEIAQRSSKVSPRPLPNGRHGFALASEDGPFIAGVTYEEFELRPAEPEDSAAEPETPF